MFKITKSLAVIALAVVAVAGGTYAYFTSQASNNNNVFTAGTLKIDITQPSTNASPVFNIPNLAPGETKTGYITIKNTGTIDFKFRGKVVATDTNSPYGGLMTNALRVTVTQVYPNPLTLPDVNGNLSGWNGVVISNAALSSINNADGAFGSWDSAHTNLHFTPNSEAQYKIDVTMDPTAGNTYQGATASANIIFDATQWNNPGWAE